MSRNQIYITQEQFDFFCQTQRPYEGFVEGAVRWTLLRVKA